MSLIEGNNTKAIEINFKPGESVLTEKDIKDIENFLKHEYIPRYIYKKVCNCDEKDEELKKMSTQLKMKNIDKYILQKFVQDGEFDSKGFNKAFEEMIEEQKNKRNDSLEFKTADIQSIWNILLDIITFKDFSTFSLFLIIIGFMLVYLKY